MKRLASCQKKEMLNLVFNNIDLNCSNISMIAAIYSSDLYYKYNINRCLQQDYNNNIYIFIFQLYKVKLNNQNIYRYKYILI